MFDTAQIVDIGQHLPATIDTAIRMLADATEPRQVIDIANTAEAMRVFAIKAQMGLKAQNYCADLRLRCERRLGQMLAIMNRNRGGRPKTRAGVCGFPTLAELGIARRLATRATTLAIITPENFEAYLRLAHSQELEITHRHLLTFHKRSTYRQQNRQRIVGGKIADLIEFSRSHKMGTILIDPPWHLMGQPIMPYDMIDIETLRGLPIAELAAERCHVHLWCLPNSYHRTAYELMEGWGFRPVGEFVWIKPQMGRGHYWRMSHEILVSGINREHDRFDNQNLNSWIEAPRGKHSEKPDIVREMIEQASPPPRLELFARRREADGWYSWGHEIAPSALRDQKHPLDATLS